MKILASLLTAVTFALSSNNVLALPISDTVIVGVKEWAQAADFTGLSWNNIHGVCPFGVCNGTLTSDSGSWDMDGWNWASIEQVNELFNAYLSGAGVGAIYLLSGVDNYYENNSEWAPAFLSDFFATCSPPGCDESYIVSGFVFQPNNGRATISTVADNALDPDRAGSTSFAVDNNLPAVVYGGWFYKAAQVPTPGTISVMVLALASLGWTRRRKLKE